MNSNAPSSWNWNELLEKATIEGDESALNAQYSNFIYRFLVYDSVNEDRTQNWGIDRHGRGCSQMNEKYDLCEGNGVVLQKMHSLLKEMANSSSSSGGGGGGQQAKIENLLEEFRRK